MADRFIPQAKPASFLISHPLGSDVGVNRSEIQSSPSQVFEPKILICIVLEFFQDSFGLFIQMGALHNEVEAFFPFYHKKGNIFFEERGDGR